MGDLQQTKTADRQFSNFPKIEVASQLMKEHLLNDASSDVCSISSKKDRCQIGTNNLNGDDVLSQCLSTKSSSSSSSSSNRRPSKFTLPFEIWKYKFMMNYDCSEDDLWKELFFAILPHFVVFMLILAYLLTGAFLFQVFDPKMSKLPFYEIVLYAFTTLTTIGYGNVVPETPSSQMFCIIFCIFGIPITFITLSNLGEWLAEFYWICLTSLKRKKELISDDEYRLPLLAILCMIMLHSFLGGILFHFWIDDMAFLPAVYFSFISITTIGYGELIILIWVTKKSTKRLDKFREICPTPNGILEMLVIVIYLGSGIVIMFTLFGSLSEMIRRLHYMDRKFTGATEVQVWFGGTKLSIRELVHLVANQFNVTPERFCEVLSELDDIVRLAHASSINNESDLTKGASESDCCIDIPSTSTVICKNSTESSLESTQTYQQGGQTTFYSTTRTTKNEDELMTQIRALSTLYHLTLKGKCTFQSPKKAKTLALAGLRNGTNSSITTSSIISKSDPSNTRKCSRFSVTKLEYSNQI